MVGQYKNACELIRLLRDVIREYVDFLVILESLQTITPPVQFSNSTPLHCMAINGRNVIFGFRFDSELWRRKPNLLGIFSTAPHITCSIPSLLPSTTVIVLTMTFKPSWQERIPPRNSFLFLFPSPFLFLFFSLFNSKVKTNKSCFNQWKRNLSLGGILVFNLQPLRDTVQNMQA